MKLKDFSELKQISDNFTNGKEFSKLNAKKYQFREMVSKKNRRWLKENNNTKFDYHKEYKDVYDKIESLFDDEKSRKWMIHIIANFIPQNKPQQVPKLPVKKMICPLSRMKLTDLKSIVIGDRDKDIAFVGKNTNVILSGIAIQELTRFIINMTYDFESKNGQIINFAIDKIRTEESE